MSARTFEYDKRPSSNAAEIAGISRSACAVRTFSRAADIDSSQRHASHSAQLRKPHFCQPQRSSNSRTSISSRYVAAFISLAIVRIATSSSSIDR